MASPLLPFLRENAAFLATGALLSFLSSFGQTFFIAIFAGELKAAFGLTDGGWGLTYMAATGASAGLMLVAGGLADRVRVRLLGPAVIFCLALACFAMAFNPVAALFPVVIFALRFFGQGMASLVALVAMVRWFTLARGRALAVATLGFMIGEAVLPLTFVWLKTVMDWPMLWVGVGLFCLAMIPVLYRLLRLERTPQGAVKEGGTVGMDGRDWTRGELLRQPIFWVLAVSIMLFPAFATAFWFHQVRFVAEKGWAHLSLVALFPLGTLAFGISTVLYGWAIDRFGAVRLLPLYLIPLVAGFAAHAYAPHLAWSAAGVVLMGLTGGGQATLPAACWAEIFGTRHLGAVKAVVTAILVFGSAWGPGLAGWLIDLGIPLERQLWCYAGAVLLAIVAMSVAVRAAQRRISGSAPAQVDVERA